MGHPEPFDYAQGKLREGSSASLAGAFDVGADMAGHDLGYPKISTSVLDAARRLCYTLFIATFLNSAKSQQGRAYGSRDPLVG